MLFAFGYFCGCFWSDFNVDLSLHLSAIPFFALFIVSALVFSFSFWGVLVVPVCCLAHAFFMGHIFYSFYFNGCLRSVSLFVLQFLIVVYYAEAISQSFETQKGIRSVLRSHDTYSFLVLFLIMFFALFITL